MKAIAIEAYEVIRECQKRHQGFSTFRYMFSGEPRDLRAIYPKTCIWQEDEESATIGGLTKK